MGDPRFTSGLLIVVIGFCVILLLLLLMLRRRRGPAGSGRNEGENRKTSADSERLRPCPICGTMLKRGERVKTVVYPGKPDSMAHIFGCPYCYPASPEISRICPVCRKEVQPEGYVVARMFEGKEKKHVHVLGCTGCRRLS